MADGTPADGIYRICSAMDRDQVVDVVGGSKANGANVMIHAKNANVVSGNHERVKLVTDPASGNQVIRFVHSGKCMDLKGAKAANGTNVQQYAANGTNAQKWRLARSTDSAGADCWQVLTSVNAGLCLDAQGGRNASGTNLIVHEVNSDVQQGDHQKWDLVRDTIYAKSYPVPASVGCATSTSGDPLQTVDVSGSGATLWPAWRCEGARFQLRYRERFRSASDPAGTWGEWSGWRCPYAEEPEANDGWGDPWDDYITDTSAGAVRHAASGVQVLFGAHDRAQLQVEVMRFEPEGRTTDMAVSGQCHGGSAVGEVTVNRLPNVQLYDFELGALGLSFKYLSDFERGGNSITGLTVTSGGKTVCGDVSFAALTHSGALTVPMSSLMWTPANGAALSVSYDWSTCDTTARFWNTATLSYAASGGLELSCGHAPGDGYTQVVTVSTPVSRCWCYLDVEQDGETRRSECEALPDGSFSVVPALGAASRVTVAAVDASNQWGVASLDLPPVDAPDVHIFNWGDGQWCQLPLDASRSQQLQRDFAAYQTNGRPRESVFFGDGSKGDVSVSGSVVEGVAEHCSDAWMDRLAVAGDCVLRTPDGKRLDVAVTSVDRQYERSGRCKVTVNMKERS